MGMLEVEAARDSSEHNVGGGQGWYRTHLGHTKFEVRARNKIWLAPLPLLKQGHKPQGFISGAPGLLQQDPG